MSNFLSRTAVIIPVRDEEASIGKVLADLPPVATVFVVNNGSTDASASIAAQNGAVVVDEPIAGYGRACLAGLAKLNQISPIGESNIDLVAFIDGDYSDHGEELLDLIYPIAQDKADFVLGSRMAGNREDGAMPPQAMWGNRLACFLMRWIWKTNYTDLGPFRVIRRQSLEQLEMTDTNFGWTVEMQVKAVVAGLKIVEVPVSYRRRIGTSKISGTISGTVKAGTKILSTIAKYAWITKRR